VSAAYKNDVVSLVLEHANNTPEVTLGVITMGIHHMMRAQAALDHALENHPELASFFDANPKKAGRSPGD